MQRLICLIRTAAALQNQKSGLTPVRSMVWSRAMQRSLRFYLSALLLLPLAAVAAESIGGTYVGSYINKAGKSGDY